MVLTRFSASVFGHAPTLSPELSIVCQTFSAFAASSWSLSAISDGVLEAQASSRANIVSPANPSVFSFFQTSAIRRSPKTLIHNQPSLHDEATINQAINGGYMVQTGDNTHVHNTNVVFNEASSSGSGWNRKDLFSLLNPIPDASHTRNLRTSPPNSMCLPGTRQDVIADVRSWVNSSLKEPHVMWIYGFAGCGKSAIAQEVASHFDRKGQLAAAFFFFRGAGDRSRVSRFATTIASQMARAIPATASYIKAALKKDPGLRLSTTSLTIQFDGLVYGPMKKLGWERMLASLRKEPFLIVLDGLDECEDRGEVAAFIQHMVDFFGVNPRIPLRFVVTSRVENHIHQLLHSSEQVLLLDLVDRTSDSDIAVALDIAIANEKRSRLHKCDESWPSPAQKAKLLEHIGGSFIFLTTIVKYLFDPDSKDGLTPMRRLPIILSTNIADFDGLYRSILQKARHLSHFEEIIGTIILALEPLSVIQIAALLGLEAVDVVNVLLHLHAVMQIPGDDRSPITLWHTSLRDFLTFEERSGAFFVSPVHHLCLAYLDLRPTSPAYAYWKRHAFNHLGKLLVSMGAHLGSRECDRASMMDLINSTTFRGGCTALEVASREEKWDIVRKLVNVKADINVRFEGKERTNVVTALHAACHHREYDMIYFLLENGADPNVSDFDTKFYYGTPLAFASYAGDIKLVTCLLKCGADPNLQGGVYCTALQAACAEGKLGVVNLLLEHGADPNVTGGHWDPALHACARINCVDCARALLEHKADPNIDMGILLFTEHAAGE
ncbi:hypothetical protein NMY22_g14399 [Coprinellus aureogranulatus]|nr:hypothetical protein NMY22_g14399 [Coprinellus aureogranulatus]